ncbi:MAG: tyrosine--tRNA ligase [Dehalococcoidia bacterium]
MDKVFGSFLKRGVTEVIVEEELKKLLEAGKPLRIKQGFDPSRPDIHLGHVVSLRKLRQFQEMGHQVILIVGDWTAQIGDPSGQSVTRPMLSAEEVRANAQTYMDQFFKVVDRKRTKVRWQSEWFDGFTLSDIIRLTSRFTVAQLLAREDFRARFDSSRPIAVTELLYPLLQAYDSVVIEADVEVGGTDQKFNCLVGRELQSMVGQRPQQVFLVPLLVGTDGRQKMSKSLDNYIGIDEPPQEMYGKAMSIPDGLIMDYFELLTDVPDEELAGFRRELEAGSVNPMLLKKRLARELVAQFHSAEAARDAEAEFERVFQRREAPEDVLEAPVSQELLDKLQLREPIVSVGKVGAPPEWYLVSMPLLLLETGLVKSRSEARRLIQQGAVEIDDNTVVDEDSRIKFGSIIKVGKRRWVKLVEANK